ncbi:hypothetical protein [Pseudomonas phage PIP]|nr:hypothetical protein [Pseudomonas phage PIP]
MTNSVTVRMEHCRELRYCVRGVRELVRAVWTGLYRF